MADDGPDRIHIRDLRLRCVIGVYPEERRRTQDVVINVTLWADLRRAGQTDRLEDTVDYKAIKQRIVEAVEPSEHYLIERLAERVAAICLDAPGVRRARVLVEKPGALRYARTVGIEIDRERGGDG